MYDAIIVGGATMAWRAPPTSPERANVWSCSSASA